MTSCNRLLVVTFALLSLASARAVDGLPQQQHPEPVAHWQAPCVELAKQIVALTGPGTITLTIANRSSIATDDVPAIRRALEQELRSDGVSVRAKDADSEVRVTLSQNLQGWLWVAEVQQGIEVRVAMLPVAGAAAPTPTAGTSMMTLRATQVAQQTEPILDFALVNVGAEQYAVTLGPNKISWYSQTNRNRPAQTYDIVHTQPLPRDVRGHIVPAADHVFDAYLPGMVCAATKNGDNLDIACRNTDDPWPVGSQKAFFSPTRNFFTGVAVTGVGPKLPPFYSAAELHRTTGTVFLYADTAGAVHILESGSHKLLIGARDWGSDIAAVDSECGSGAQVVASAAGWAASDSIRAYEISGREARPVSDPIVFFGTVTAVWPAPDGKSAIAVVDYQDQGWRAYSVAVVCSH
jgi:hypothetical protein